jgi:thermopsin
MQRVRALRAGIIVAVTVVMMVSGSALLGSTAASLPVAASAAPGPSANAGSAPALAHVSSASPAAAMAGRIHAALGADHVPASDVFLPNFNAKVPVVNHTVSPLYSQAPAPMGLGYFGTQEVHGRNVGTVSYTSSVEGVLTLGELNSTYLDASGPDTVSIQLNTVLTGVDLFGDASYQFWVQNVPVYIPHLDQLSILDNIWNFSSPAFNLTPNSFYKYDGVEVPPIFYYANGPTFHPGLPFTVRVYNNASLYRDRPVVYLNYSLTESNGRTISGSYDRVVFNSTGLLPARTPAPRPSFQIDGRQYGANGYLPNDAELMLGGSDDGSTTSVSDVQGSMQLLTLPNGTSTYQSVPAAYDFGTDTGETTEGMAEWSSNGTAPEAHLGPGPSFLVPLWGLAGAVFGHVDQQIVLSPSNAFVFVSQGSTFRVGTAEWAPLPVSGFIDYQLPPGTYSYEALLSEHRPVKFTLTGTDHFIWALLHDPKLGVYTPLWAWNNDQLAAISEPGGNGTVANPYVLMNRPGVLNPLFGQFNDFEYPVFMGVFLSHTTDYVSVEDAP